VNDEHAAAARALEQRGDGPMAFASSETSLPSVSPKPPGSRKSRCMSMTTTAVRPRSSVIGSGLGFDLNRRHGEATLARESQQKVSVRCDDRNFEGSSEARKLETRACYTNRSHTKSSRYLPLIRSAQ